MKSVSLSRRALLLGMGSLSALTVAPGPSSLFAGVAEASTGTAASAVKSALAGQFDYAADLAQQSGNKPAINLVELLYLRDKEEKAGFSRIRRFLASAPNWPLSETLTRNAEAALLAEQRSTQDVLDFFDDREPLTAKGNYALARACYASGNSDKGRACLLRAWFDADLGAENERKIISEFGSKLSDRDHINRMWHLVLAQQPLAAIRNAKRIGANYPAAAEAAHYLIGGAAGAEKKYNALSASMQQAPALKYALARYYRRLEKFAKARAVLATIPGDASVMLDADAFWAERRIIARRSVGPRQRGNYQTAYQIARNHGAAAGDTAFEGEFLAGWIALRYLNEPDTALKHFAKLPPLAVTRTDKTRAAYWTGRAYVAKKDMDQARASFKEAAKYPTLYHAQLAREHIGQGSVASTIGSGTPSADAVARVGQDDVVQALRLVDQAGGQDRLNMFLWSLAKRFNSTADMNAVAAVVAEVGDQSMALRFAKAAAQRGVDIDAWAYPVRAIPDWKQVGKPVEKALVFGLSRQESEFNANAGSLAGAQGLMQLMPGTARLVAQRYGLPFAVGRLKGDPAYNVKLGAAHLSELIQDYRGSYVLTLVAYNAGPRRVDEWIAAFGDPRSASVDVIDWVESIPFQETRQYVQKVLQNLQVYRSRLAPDSVKPLSADLTRGGSSAVTVASTDKAPEPDCNGRSIHELLARCD